jgi:hypothetical protein
VYKFVSHCLFGSPLWTTSLFVIALLNAASPVYAQFSFAAPTPYTVGGTAQAIATADLNRDSLPDAIVGTIDSVKTLLNRM